jgi:ribosomal protein L44E
MILSSPQTTLVVGEDKPLPGGLAKGVGNLSPEMPCTKCGNAFAKNAPDKKFIGLQLVY